MIYILYGEMCSGKTYLGKQIAKHLGCNFYDGDDALPSHLEKKVNQGKGLSLKEVDDFVKNNLIPYISDSWIATQDSGGQKLVVAQALYRSKHREMVHRQFEPYIRWIQVKCPFKLQMQRLLSRPSGYKWLAQALLAKPFYQNGGSVTIKNYSNFIFTDKQSRIL